MAFSKYVVDATIMLQAMYTVPPNSKAQSVSHSHNSRKGLKNILTEKGSAGLISSLLGNLARLRYLFFALVAAHYHAIP
jgi:hypothetical protein